MSGSVHNGGRVLWCSVCERFFDPLLAVLKHLAEMAQENVGARVNEAVVVNRCLLTGVVELQDACGRWSDEPSVRADDSCKRGCECGGGKGCVVEIV
jgi:hypothetical protein